MNVKESSLKPPELYLIILWELARPREQQILEDLQQHHKILGIYDITWSKAHFSSNLTRFYGENLPANSPKERHCGNGTFRLITFLDENPVYKLVNTSRGSEYVDDNVFALKERYRQWTGGGHKIHASNNPLETRHDLTLLLGVNYDDYLAEMNARTSLPLKESFSNDLIGGGDKGWSSLKEMLAIMNRSLNYLTLRNFEVLPDNYYADDHGDIDFLVDDIQQAAYVIGAKKIHKQDYRVYYSVRINGEEVFIDLRHVGDDYYDARWEKNMLKNRVLSKKGFYIPGAKDYLYSLVYHALFHKKIIADDYYGKIVLAAKELGDEKALSFGEYYQRLLAFLDGENYQIICPKDKSVFFDTRYLAQPALAHEFDLLGIHSIKPFMADSWKNGSGYIYFQGISSNDQKVFIKAGGLAESSKREFLVSQKIQSVSEITSPQALYCRYNKGINFVVFKMMDSNRTLEDIEPTSLTESQRVKILQGIVNAIKGLHSLKLIHRDIRPANFLITDNFEPILIDYQFTVDVTRRKLKEFKEVRIKPETICRLGDAYARGRFRWDDAFSAMLIFDEYAGENMNAELLQMRTELKALVGEKQIFGLKSNKLHCVRWYAKSLAEIVKFRSKILFYEVAYALSRKNKFLKKLDKSRMLLARIWNFTKF